MRKDIHIVPIMAGSGDRSVPAFTVQFSYPDRLLANKVVQDVVGRFIAENLTNRSNATTETTQFLKDQAEQAKKELEAAGSRGSPSSEQQNNGRLPDQVDMNYRQLQTSADQLSIPDQLEKPGRDGEAAIWKRICAWRRPARRN